MMKLKEGFVLRQVAGETVVLPSHATLDLNVMITLNETGALLWQRLESGAEEAELVSALTQEYDIDEVTAAKHTAAFVEKLRKQGFLA